MSYLCTVRSADRLLNGWRTVITVAMAVKDKYKHIVSLFNKLIGAHQLWELWEDAMTFYALSISNVVDERFKAEREERYMNTMKK